jgi:hypothetical protein
MQTPVGKEPSKILAIEILVVTAEAAVQSQDSPVSDFGVEKLRTEFYYI